MLQIIISKFPKNTTTSTKIATPQNEKMASNMKITSITTMSKKKFEAELDHEAFEEDAYAWETHLHKDDFELIKEE